MGFACPALVRGRVWRRSVRAAAVLCATLPVLGCSSGEDEKRRPPEDRIAELKETLASSKEPRERARRLIELGLVYRGLYVEHTMLSRPRKGVIPTPEVLAEAARHKTEAEAVFEKGVAVFAEVCDEHAGTEFAPAAMWYLQGMYADREPKRCVELCQRLLSEYPDATLPMLSGGRTQFNVYLNMASAYALLGERRKAVDAHVQSLLALETPEYRRAGVMRLLEYEPRLALPAYRAMLSNEARDAIEDARANAPVRVVLGPPTQTVAQTKELRLQYQFKVPNSGPKYRGWCLEFCTIDYSNRATNEASSLDCNPPWEHLGRSPPLPTDGATQTFSANDKWCSLRPGRHHVVARVKKVRTPAAVPEWMFGEVYWCEPVVVNVLEHKSP